MQVLESFLQTSVQLGTPLLFATVGGILCEKSGHLNLGVEGMMLMGAVMGFATAFFTGNPFLSIMIAGFAGAVGALIYAIVTITLRGNQIVTGLTLTIFGAGVANFVGKSVSEVSLPESIRASLGTMNLPFLHKIPIIGPAIFEQSIFVPMSIIVAICAYIYLAKTKTGLAVRAVGENPGAADASGIRVGVHKYAHVLTGGFLCGIGGSFLSLVYVPRWQDDLTAGMGWIAVVLIIFSTWNPLKAIFGAYFFGALQGLGFKLQSLKLFETSFPTHLLSMIPYIATIVVLIFITMRKKKEDQAPAGLGTPYFREDR